MHHNSIQTTRHSQAICENREPRIIDDESWMLQLLAGMHYSFI